MRSGSMMASVRNTISFSASLQKAHVVLHVARSLLQTCTLLMVAPRLGLVPGHLCVRLVTKLLVGTVLLPHIHCHLGPVHYSSYEIVIPESLTVKGSQDPGGRTSYMLLIQGHKQLIHLKVKRDYFVDDFPVYSYHNGNVRQETPSIARDCHYEGYIEGASSSFVSVSACSGLRGILIKENTSYGIEPILSSQRFEHVLYTMARQAPVSCRASAKDSQAVSTSWQQGSRKPHSVQALSSYLWVHTKYVEMFVVVNNQRFQMWGSDVNETVQRVVDIIALANIFTRGINTEVVLAGVEVWTEGDLIEVPVDLRVTLRNFNRWRQDKLLPRVKHDVAHMIVGHHPGETSGQAFLNGACSSGFAAAVEAFHHEDALLSAALLVHELGHNLGIRHDHSACVCRDKHSCLMQENITEESGFSNCSSDYFYHFLHEHRGACLFNKPWHKARRRRAATCGNGVVEESEQCDCGVNCDTSECCDQACNFKGNATCSNELCCSDCQYKNSGYLCRPSVGPCDLPEYCTGQSGKCPLDTYKQDGTPCNEGFFCVSKGCTDPGIQCATYFGHGARSAPDACYTTLNSIGNIFGNCGQSGNPTTYVGCSGDSTKCGKLICTGISSIPPIRALFAAIQIPHGDDWCWSISNFGDPASSPTEGAVSAGTSCASGKACVNAQCSTFTLETANCSAAEMCNENGICNNLGHCHCGDGFAPPNCKEQGTGGSIDSGPPPPSSTPTAPPKPTQTTKASSENLALIGLIILVILLLLLVICAICLGIPAEEAPPPPEEEEAGELEEEPEPEPEPEEEEAAEEED
uniref:Disintegrin and metalloproteinase domain-containing protein 1a-like n=1 Tax=Cavia porcellus TaxID=10141 RepID=H0W5X6_CAVPO